MPYMIADRVRKACHEIIRDPMIGDLVFKTRRSYSDEYVRVSYNYHSKGNIEFVTYNLI